MKNKQELSNVSSIFGIKRRIFVMENMPSFYEKLRKNNKFNQYIDNFEKRAVAMYDELIENGKIAMDDPSFGKISYAETMTEIRYFAMQDVIESMIENLDEDEFEDVEDEEPIYI